MILQYRPHWLRFEHEGCDIDACETLDIRTLYYGMAPQRLIGRINGFVLGTLDTGYQWVNLRSSDQKLLPAEKIFAFPYIFYIYIHGSVKFTLFDGCILVWTTWFSAFSCMLEYCKSWDHQTWSVDASWLRVVVKLKCKSLWPSVLNF